VHHQLVDEVRVCLRMVNELEYRLRVLVYPGQKLFVEITALSLELGSCQMTQVVISLANKLLCVEERVD